MAKMMSLHAPLRSSAWDSVSIMWLGYLHKVTRESEFSVRFNSGECEYVCLSIFEGVTELELCL